MSITFFPTQPNGDSYPTRIERVPCKMCAKGICQPGWWCVDGIEENRVPTAPECNFANMNAIALMRAVGLDGDTGALDAMELPALLAEINTARGNDASGMIMRSSMIRAEERTRNSVICGSSDEDARRRLDALAGVVAWAVENGAGLAWA